MKKSWKPLINIVGLVLIVMMTAASVSAEDPLARDNQLPDDGAVVTGYADDNEGGDEPMLIAPGETEETSTSDIPDYQNYTGDMLISPSPEANSEAKTSLYFPIAGVIGVVLAIALVIIGITLKRK